MSIRFLIAAAAAVAVPAVVVAQESAPPRKNTTARRYCDTYTDVHSRLQNRRRCQTKAEREALKQDARQTVDRIQTMKATQGR